MEAKVKPCVIIVKTETLSDENITCSVQTQGELFNSPQSSEPILSFVIHQPTSDG